MHDQLEQITTGIVIENQYTYDISGNRLTDTSYGHTTSYVYDGQNNLTTINGSQTTYTTCTYDANGERLMRYNQTHYYYYYYDGVNLLFVKKDIFHHKNFNLEKKKGNYINKSIQPQGMCNLQSFLVETKMKREKKDI